MPITGYSNTISVTTSAPSLLLDLYPSAAAAYSVRLLRTAYTGSAIRVRRSSDNTEQDIGFSGGNLDSSALTTFCSGTNGFVTTWYDQSGNGRNGVQSTAANQPQIVSSGSVLNVNSKPSLQFDGSNDILNLTLFTVSNYSHFSIMTKVSTGTTGTSLGNDTGQSIAVASDNNWYENSSGTFLQGIYANNTNQNLFSVIKSGNTISDFAFTQNATTLTGFSGTAFSTMNIEHIGSRGNFFFTENLQEIVLYNSAQTSNATGIKSDINTYYGIY